MKMYKEENNMKWFEWTLAVVWLVVGIGHWALAANGTPVEATWLSVICKDFLIALLWANLAIFKH